MDLETCTEIEFSKAEPKHAEGIARLYDNAYRGTYSLLEFTDPDSITRIINNEELIWYVALSEGEVIGSAVGDPDNTNNTFEQGRVVVFPKKFRRAGIIGTLSENIIEEGLETYDLCWFSMRGVPGISFAEGIGAELVGYHPGQHKTDIRENHLIYFTYSPRFQNIRVAPFTPGEVESFYSNFRSPNTTQGQYPNNILAGPAEGDTKIISGSRVHFHYHERDNSILIHQIYPPNNAGIRIKELLEYAPFSTAEYIQLDILADKFRTVHELNELGFNVVGYLPGWHEREGKRYDCIRMAYAKSPSVSRDHHIDQRVAILQDQFNKEKIAVRKAS